MWPPSTSIVRRIRSFSIETAPPAVEGDCAHGPALCRSIPSAIIAVRPPFLHGRHASHGLKMWWAPECARSRPGSLRQSPRRNNPKRLGASHAEAVCGTCHKANLVEGDFQDARGVGRRAGSYEVLRRSGDRRAVRPDQVIPPAGHSARQRLTWRPRQIWPESGRAAGPGGSRGAAHRRDNGPLPVPPTRMSRRSQDWTRPRSTRAKRG